MADDPMTVTTTSAAAAQTKWSALARDRIARTVVVGSFLTIFLLVAALIGVAQVGNSPAVSQLAQNTFNSILPVLAGWVGSVLAFYFSSQSLETTSRNLDTALGQVGRGPGQATPVSQKMIPLEAIRGLIDLAKLESPPTIAEMQAQFNMVRQGGLVTRLMIVKNGVFQYVVHIGTLNAFLVAHSTPAATPPTLDDLTKDPDFNKQISSLVGFTTANATLAEAKAKLDSVAGAQDLIVTSNGDKDSAMIGWLTNVDLLKALSTN